MSNNSLINEMSYNNLIQSPESLSKGHFTRIMDSNRDLTQTKTSIPKKIKTYLEKQYLLGGNEGIKFTFLNNYEKINIEGTISLKNTGVEDKFYDAFYAVRDFRQFSTMNKYSSMSIDRIEDGYVYFDYIDNLGNNKQKKEKLTVFKNYILSIDNVEKIFAGYVLQYVKLITVESERVFNYVITNNVHKKYEAVLKNEGRNSCQGKTIRIKQNHYAWGLYDFFNNGCLVPLIIYEDGKVVARAAFRYFYDEKGQRYLLLERIFGEGFIVANLKPVCLAIVKELIDEEDILLIAQEFTVTSTFRLNYRYEAIKTSGLYKLTKLSSILRQPKRLYHSEIKQGYYQDSKIYTINQKGSKYIYDLIDGSNSTFYIISKK